MPKHVLPLTEARIRAAEPQKEKSYKLTDGQGLFLEVLSSGGKSWRFKYRFDGQEKRLVFGLWPAVSLKLARQRRDEARALVARGVDPGEKRKSDKAGARATFRSVAREWHEKQRNAWTEVHAAKIMGRLERHVFPAIGKIPIAELRAPAILPLLREVESRKNFETAKRLRQYIEAVCAYSIATGRSERNVGADLRGALEPCRVKNRPALTDPRDVAALLRAIDGYSGSPVTLAALKLSALTFVRPGEMRHAEWAEINLEAENGPQWVIPSEKMKMRRDHIVPLSSQAVEIINTLFYLTGHDRYLFPCNRGNGRCMSNMTMNAALRRLGYEQDEMCAHGFRAMASTLLNEQGWNSDVIERQLAHKERNAIRAAYNRAEYLPERRRMMQSWADYLDALKAGAKVSLLHSAAG